MHPIEPSTTHHTVPRQPIAIAATKTRQSSLPYEEILSPALRRRVVSLLRMRLFELRLERLDRVRTVIEQRLQADELFSPESPPSRPP